LKKISWILLGLVFLLISLIRLASGIYLDLLWYEQLGYGAVFTTILSSYWGIRLLAWLFFSIFLFINLNFTQKALLNMPNLVLRQMLMNTKLGNLLTKKWLRIVFLLASVVFPWLLTAGFGDHWLPVRLFFAGAATGITEPIFARDVSFYLFTLPFYELIYQYLLVMIATTAILSGAIYLFIQPPEQLGLRSLFARRGQTHISLLLAGLFLVVAAGYRLQMYNLLLSARGATFGPGYTDMNAQLPAYWILLGLSLVVSAVLLYNAKVKNPRLIAGSVITLIVGSILIGGIFPAAMQSFIVEPNEFSREEPFLGNNIEFTRLAYGLDRIERQEFPLTGTLDYQGLLENQGTLNNIRLWDWRPLRQTYNQLQGLRPYYRFHDVDTDRYIVNGEYRQLMLSGRELVAERLPARTWQNERLFYTHGYGVVASPVNEVTGQGMPVLGLRDLPVQSDFEGLHVDVPQIYYGELTNSYIFTGAVPDEFDYPMGDTNASYRYDGEGGVPLGGFLNRLLFALRFSDYRMLISGELKPESRIHFYRTLDERMQRLAPFLRPDPDPYLVVADGRLFWMVDTYTVTSRYPYSEPHGNINYIRNAAKAVVDAYHGTVNFYVFEPDDPLIQAYAAIFPDLFQPAGEMPEYLKRHVRYPEELLKIQSRMYATYHMQNTQVFYNKEDRWQLPQEIYEGSPVTMDPYYTIIRLPGEDEPEFVLMVPYTPITRANMVAWLAARSDGDNYGQLRVYLFPRGELIYGPAQIEARIDQDSRISEQLTLWDQRGSNVIRGNLLVLPVNGSILYVEPIYLRAEQGELPELARVIVAYGERIVMERTLEEALAAVFGLQPGLPPVDDPAGPDEPLDPDEPVAPPAPSEPITGTVLELVEQAARLFEQAEAAQRRGDWAEYGRLQQELGAVLSHLQELSTQNQ
jgi:uncharacterized membrane protein (UPF0182 family)